MGPARIFADGFLLSLSLCADLGVVNMAVIRLGLTRGARAAWYLGMGSCVGDMIYGLGSVSLVSLLSQHRGVRMLLWIGGSGVMLWLAARMLRETLYPRDLELPAGAPDDLRPEREFGRGAMLALSSPSSILWFAVVGGSVIAAHAASPHALLPFFSGFFAAGMLWTLMIAALAGYAHRRLGPRFVRALSLLSVLLFVYFAFSIFSQGYREFVLPPA
jgi:L-lysine exporter family protein LysE/ArgO